MLGFIIIGWPEKQKSKGKVAPGMCPHCRNQSVWHLVKTRRWATIFFIPILPLSRASYHVVCDICEIGIEVDDVSAAKELYETTEEYENHEIAEADYTERVNEFWQSVGAEPHEEDINEPEQIKGIQ